MTDLSDSEIERLEFEPTTISTSSTGIHLESDPNSVRNNDSNDTEELVLRKKKKKRAKRKGVSLRSQRKKDDQVTRGPRG